MEKILEKYLEAINKNYIKFLLCFRLFELNNKFRDPNASWAEMAEENLLVMNWYNSIFQVLDFWMLDLAIFEMQKIFEKNKPKKKNTPKKQQSWVFSLITLIDFLKEHQEEVNTYLEKKFNQTYEEYSRDYKSDYFPIETIEEFKWWIKLLNTPFFDYTKAKLKEFEDKITNLKNARDNRGHNLEELKLVNLKYQDLEDLKKLFEDLFNYINSYITGWIYDFMYVEKYTQDDFKLLVLNLSKFKKIRSIFYDNYLEKQNKSDLDILMEIKGILKIDF